MRVGVIGGTGNLGLALVERLVQNQRVTATVVVSRRRPEELPEGAEWRAGDLAGEVAGDVGDALGDVDAVVHTGWLFQPSHSPEITWASNVLGTDRLLRHIASTSRIRTLVYSSSLGAYSPAPGDRVDEAAPTHGIPTASYSLEKVYVERLLDVFEREHPEVRVVRMRPVFIVGRESAVEQRRLFGGPLAPGRAIARWGLPLLPDPGARFQVVHRTDAARAFELALEADVRGAFNLATDPSVGFADLARHLRARVVPVPRKAIRAAVHAAWHAHLAPVSPGMVDLITQSPLLDSRRARTVLGWAPQWTPDETLADLVHGLATNTGAPTPPLSPATSGRWRLHELRTGIGERP